MKVIKANLISSHDTGYVCHLTFEEAVVIKSMMGRCAGTGANQQITNNIYNKLKLQGIPNTPQPICPVIAIQG